MRNSGGSCKCIEEIVFAVIPAKAGIQKSLVLKNIGFPIKTSGMTNKDFCKDRGFTLIELLVVITIIGVLAIALGFSFEGWQGRYRVESTIKNIESDLNKARASAMQRSRAHFVNFPAVRSYTIYEDDSDGTGNVPDGDGIFQPGIRTDASADEELPSFPKTIDYDLTWNGAGSTVTFDTRGVIQLPERTICIFTDFDGDPLHKSDVEPDYDCLVLSQTRISLGKLTTQDTAGGVCNNTNCVQR